MKVMAVLILVYGPFWSNNNKHEYFNNYTECNAAVDNWVNNNSGFMKAARGFCVSKSRLSTLKLRRKHMIPNWQYKVEHLDEEEIDLLEEKLNKLGREGWELVSWDSETGILKRRELYITEPYTGDGTHKKRPDRNPQPELN